MLRVGVQRLRGKPFVRPVNQALQAAPVEAGAGIGFAAGGNVFVAGQLLDGVLLGDRLYQVCQRWVLCGSKRSAFQALQLDADGIVVALVATAPA